MRSRVGRSQNSKVRATSPTRMYSSIRPSAAMISSVGGWVVEARGMSLIRASASSSVTLWPWRAQASAATLPTGPAPTTKIFLRCMARRLYGAARDEEVLDTDSARLAAWRTRAGLAAEAAQGDRAVPARRGHRLGGAHHRRVADAAPWPAGGGGKPPGRERRHCRGLCGTRGPRRLYPFLRLDPAAFDPAPRAEDHLRPAQGFRARLHRRHQRLRAGLQREGARCLAQGVHRLRQ